MIYYLKSNKIVPGLVFQLLLIFSFASANFILYTFTIIYLLFLFITDDSLKKNTKSVFFLTICYLGIILLMVLLKVYDDPYLIFKSLFSIIGIFAAGFFVKDQRAHYLSSAWALVIFQIFVFFSIIYFGFADFPFVSPLEKIFPGKSGNGITSYVIILQIHFFISHIGYELRNNKFLYLTIVCTLLVSMATYARGSLISALLLVIITFLVFKVSKSVILGLTLIIFSTLAFNYDNISLFFTKYSKLGQGLQDYSRTEALRQYLDKIDGYTFFMGADYNNTIIIKQLNGNPHNSFIRAHYNYGIFYLLFILCLFASPVLLGKGMKRNILYGSLMFVLLFRIWTEPVLFPTIFDFYFFSIIFLIVSYERKVIKL